MADIVSGILQKQLGGNGQGMEKQMLQQSPTGGRSFESHLQQKSGQPAPDTAVQSPNKTNQINRVEDPKLEPMRVDLMQRLQNLPEGAPKVSAIFPEYLDTKTRMSSFKDILNKAIGSTGSTPQATDVKGRFSQVENEWQQLDTVMRSGKDMSQGELLGLQARLYQVSQHIDVLSKVVDQMTGGIKTILNTNV